MIRHTALFNFDNTGSVEKTGEITADLLMVEYEEESSLENGGRPAQERIGHGYRTGASLGH